MNSNKAIAFFSGFPDRRFTEVSAKRYFIERLLAHEIGHCADYARGLLNSRSGYKEENFADNYAYGYDHKE